MSQIRLEAQQKVTNHFDNQFIEYVEFNLKHMAYPLKYLSRHLE